MGDKKNLDNQQAIKKIIELGNEIKTCMFCTYPDGRLKSRPMSAQQIDEEGNIWFLSNKNSDKNRELKKDAGVDILFAQGHDKFLAIHGSAEIYYDKQKIEELWQPIAKIWFTKGTDDPAISIIKVKADGGYYWDTKHGKMVETLKMAASLVTGKAMDDGIEGALKSI